MKAHTRIIIWLLAIGIAASSYINVAVNQPGHKISSVLWGIFIEEISHAGDGGLYGELIKNRALAPKLPNGDLDGYAVVKSEGVDGQISISKDNPLNDVLTSSLRLDVTTDVSNGQRIGISNSGFWGIPIRPDYTSYRASFYAKSSGSFRGPLIVSLEKADGSIVYASAQVDQITDQFQKYEVVLTPQTDLIQQASLDNVFVISAPGPIPRDTSIFFNVVSLFPPTFKNRSNGMRIDVAQMLADAKPRFHRFPGGNFLEGNNIAERFIWEETLGDISRRPGHQGCWGYYSSDGLGLLEYAQFTEDIGATLILGVFAGYALNGETTRPEDLGPFVDSALNEIEYLIGDANTTWGARRIADGREQPFDLRYVEIGNEDFFSKDYDARYPVFYDAISARYPQLEIIATTRTNTRPTPIVDDHFYQELGWCPDNHRYYDNHPRDGPKIFVGEYACKDNTLPKSSATLAAAIDNAAWMTGLERNSDVVELACYAPLLGHVNDPAGTTDAIYYNGIVTYGTAIWWVFHLFGVYQGDTYIPSDSDANNGRPNEKIFHVVSRDSGRNVLIVKIVNTLGDDIMIDTVQLSGIENTRGGNMTILTGGGRWDLNDIDNPRRVYPKTDAFNIDGNSFSYNAPAWSLSVFEFQL